MLVACAILMACKQYAYTSFQASGGVSLRSSLFWYVTEPRSVVTEVSGQRVGPTFVAKYRSLLRNVPDERRSQYDARLCVIPCTFIPQPVRNFIIFNEWSVLMNLSVTQWVNVGTDAPVHSNLHGLEFQKSRIFITPTLRSQNRVNFSKNVCWCK